MQRFAPGVQQTASCVPHTCHRPPHDHHPLHKSVSFQAPVHKPNWLLNFQACTVGLHLSGLIRTAIHPDMQKIRIIGFLFENWLHLAVWSSAVTIYNMYLRLNHSTMPDLKFQKP